MNKHALSPPRKDLTILGILGVLCLLLLLGDYFTNTRPDAQLALALSQVGPDTPLELYMTEFGQPIHHFTDIEIMKSWGPRTDDNLLAKAELYYFSSGTIPYRYVIVYIDKTTKRSLYVSWKSM